MTNDIESLKKQNVGKDNVIGHFDRLPEKKMSAETNNTSTKSEIQQDVSNEEINQTKKPTECRSQEEIIQENLKELLDKKNREERKANGRYIAVIVAFLVIFLAIYHAWIRKTGVLAGVLVPAVIMISYGCWVVILAKRDKQKRAIFKKHLEEVAAKNKTELIEKAKLKQHTKKSDRRPPTETTTLQYENELTPKIHKNGGSGGGEHRKQRKHRNHRRMDGESAYQNSLHVNQKDASVKRPSFRQKLFRQSVATTATTNTTNDKVPAAGTVAEGGLPTLHIPLQSKKKRLQRLNALPEPHMVRMSSAP